jgi:hypothetical protein
MAAVAVRSLCEPANVRTMLEKCELTVAAAAVWPHCGPQIGGF